MVYAEGEICERARLITRNVDGRVLLSLYMYVCKCALRGGLISFPEIPSQSIANESAPTLVGQRKKKYN